ncbi:S1 RNA-binding domain-containing protein [Candidatus Nomurabacteria bacterium]|uniref:S1 RNA-binding domain-containing protein n=1 Tax=candidate division WWE3 bacterium TaxID=2053526 RepID=A0A955IWF2_UNCKA|nr:S1 RNA-binding domain-containing protein [candidate division WWE3 bacterium]MCB9823587.1 S1 RNA-binding domain-containing protein [Candidatus Nomurabacteria bacterium]MCB9827382.1 S1 RNA-binding domain-containing protein [Candidatus Nomurabacteria bacterium]HXK52737.1 S1 RNA-binding domain-containing protein [bacterium]
MPQARKISNPSPVMDSLLGKAGANLKQYAYGELVEGVVVSVTHSEVLLDLGAKSEGIITGEELQDSDRSYKSLKVGDTVLAMVVQAENDQGYIVLSLKRAEKDKKWKTIEDAFDTESVLEVQVLEYTKGGLLVDCLGLRGFVPLSHLDRVHFANDLAKTAGGSETELKESLKVLAGKTLKAKVIEQDRLKNRLVLSEKDATAAYSDEAKKERLDNIKEGDELDGIVTGVMPFGLFVDLEGVEGLVHISEIAWEKVSSPAMYYKVGSPIHVKVLGIDEESQKLALSVKRLIKNPWDGVEDRYPIGSRITGVVSKIVPFGAFVTLEKGLDGLIHVSEAAGPLNVGDEVEAVITNVDGEKQKLALSTRLISN